MTGSALSGQIRTSRSDFWRIFALSAVTRRRRPTWRSPPFGALTAASTISYRSSLGTGSGFSISEARVEKAERAALWYKHHWEANYVRRRTRIRSCSPSSR